jgi:carboxymethylenebutenolidase
MRITLSSGTAAEIVRVDAPSMGLVITPDIFGLRPLFDEHVTRFARDWNMSVIAVEPFPGQEIELGADVEKRFAAVPHIHDDVQLRDLELAADELGTSRVGLMGFCMGGMYCFKAARSTRFDRIVSFYGMIALPDAWKSSHQGEPLEILSQGHADRVLAVIGARDAYTPPVDVEKLQKTNATVQVYVEAEHGFAHDVSRPAHRSEDAADAFARAERWLRGE